MCGMYRRVCLCAHTYTYTHTLGQGGTGHSHCVFTRLLTLYALMGRASGLAGIGLVSKGQCHFHQKNLCKNPDRSDFGPVPSSFCPSAVVTSPPHDSPEERATVDQQCVSGLRSVTLEASP